MTDIAALHDRFGIPGVVDVAPAAGNLPAIAITTPQAEALVYLHGAHVTHFQPLDRQPLLFLSDESLFVPGKAIRGGIPVILPWFGPHKSDPKAPSHGFVRTMPWTLSNVAQNIDGSVTVTLALTDDESTRQLWPHPFALEYRITVGNSLTLQLNVRNPGTEAFTFEEALHSYFAVEDSRQIVLKGLQNRDYLDKTQKMKRLCQTEADLQISAETDRHYLATPDAVTIHDPAAGRDIGIAKEHSEVTVVWNPWIEKSQAFADLGDDEWQKFVCVETANAYDYAIRLDAGSEHTMTTRIAL